jgi:hypothetical protein
MIIDEELRQEQFILDVLPEVVEDKLLEDTDLFIEALGFDGYHREYGDNLDGLRMAIVNKDYERIGRIVATYTTNYVSKIAYDEIDSDMEKYGYDFRR